MTFAVKIVAVMAVAVMAVYLLDRVEAKMSWEEAKQWFYRVPSTRSNGRMPRKGGCASFGHSCFGGHGKRSDDSVHPLLPLDPADYQVLEIFRRFCTLQPDQYIRLAPVFQKLASAVSAEEEPLPRK